jgi:hypothetical protein
MQRKNRGYKRGEPFRDSTLFVLACEGAVREREYFELLGEKSSRIRFKVLRQDGKHRSAPKWVLDCAAKYSTEIGLLNDDQLWIIMDTDRWPDEQLHGIHSACEGTENWYLALSNPCFEVWLYMHIDEIQTSTSISCGDLKKELASKSKGGYNKHEYVDKIRIAHERAMASDKDPDHFIPSTMSTKIYRLTAEIFRIIGSNST